ncbi:MAG: GNAT family N-acetyltransferase [Steroidobacteraceae bacterium]
MEHSISHEDDGRRGAFFILQDGRRISEMSYVRSGASVVIDHTLVAPELRGRNVARSLLDAAVDWARRTDTKLSATCSYVQVQFARDSGLRDVIGHDVAG